MHSGRWRLPLSLAVAASIETNLVVGTLFLYWHPAETKPDAPAMTVVFEPLAEPAPPAPERVEPSLSAPPDARVPPPAVATPALAEVPALAPMSAVQVPDPVELSLSNPPSEQAPPSELQAPVLAEVPTLALLPKVQAPSLLRRAAPARQHPREQPATAERPPAQQEVAQAAPPASASAPAALQPSAAVAATFDGLLRQAIQAAVRYPAAAQMMGLAGRARIAFDYRDGAVGAVRLERSAGSPLLDGAALAAVRSAHYPSPPQELAGQTLSRQLWVELEPGGG